MFLANFLIGLREGLEAGLIVGILVAYLNKLGRRDVLRRLWIGVVAAVVISLATGAILTWGPYGLSSQGQEALGGVLSILAVVLVTWMIFWMGRHARDLKHDLQSKLDTAIAGTGMGIVLVGLVSVAREGVETALFIWANVSSGTNAVLGTVAALLGVAVSAAVAYLIYRGLVRINLSRFFFWTGLFLIVVAAGVLLYGIGDLQEAGLLPGHGQPAFSLAAAVPPTSWYGSLLGGLFNFTPEPSWLQFGAWLIYLVIVAAFFLRQSTAKPARTALSAAAVVVALTLSGCVPNHVASGTSIAVAITDDSCVVAETTAATGAITFALENSGSDVNEFEILADDKLRIVGEKENVTPGQAISYIAQLAPGTYYTACKFQQVGGPIGLAEFTVTGEASAVSASEQALTDTAVANYISYIKSQVGELLPQVAAFTAAYAAGDDATARTLFPTARVSYERIEPTAEAFGDLDPKIDYREVDATADGLDWTGFHRIEKDLWPPAAGALNSDGEDAMLNWQPSTMAQRQLYADALNADVQKLADTVNAADFSVTLADISNGAIALLDEVAVGKITGEEDWWSHTDLYDFLANVQGAEVAFGTVKDIAASKGTDGTALVADIETEFATLEALLAKYGSFEAGFTSYDQVTEAQRKQLSDQVNALAEPLSKLTHTVLGVAE